ncbi:AarF/ABC1/UbiB kinase family protein [Salinisphaera sp. Q1T1-3]|uniref:ABC1 kinase family protein n=1 Tax=Salinisphaera sp. Q1T1-3 TaxID=2321229 RepID=UPI000E71A545|nr:AarF/ABC1/UbiB kinase family protein [Salinisphaera sp. Q1T1-3]RJS94437.1 AarF/ABC1/UbiB kinase family protein [Salinisphaera sp. Q1T1-3]
MAKKSDGDKRKPLKLKTGSFDRNAAMARMGMVAGASYASHTFGNLFRSKADREARNREFYVRQAQFLADELGQLKGSVMKVGQMLSVYGQYFMPPEAIEVLRSLQDDSPPVAWGDLAPVVRERLGDKRLSELEIDEEPLAAASLGQVHRARRRSDGRELCIKIQYPRLADAIDSDIRTLTNIVRLARLVPKGVELNAVMEEVREMIYREVDYDRELRMTREFGERLAHDGRYVVPEVFPEYSTETVLVTSYEQASHVQSEAVANLPQARRDRLGEAALELFFLEFFNWGIVQTDPHFGNYKVRVDDNGDDDKFVLLDFGATREFGPRFLGAYYDTVAGAFEKKQDKLIDGAIGISLLRRDSPQHVFDDFAKVGMLIIEPFEKEPPRELATADHKYKWGESDLFWRVSKAVQDAAISRWFRIPPREIVFLHRRLGGVFVLLSVLDVELNTHDLLASYLYQQNGRIRPDA